MFDWWWWFLFSITETFFRIIDLITAVINKISGIEDITVEGESTTLLDYIFASKQIAIPFAVCMICAFIFTFLFTVIQIVINFSKERTDETPISIMKKGVKTLFVAFCVPLFMIIFFTIGNAFVAAMYKATSQGSESMSQFMFGIFAQDALNDGYDSTVFSNGLCNWYDDSNTIEQYIDISDFDFIYSWIISGIVCYCLLTSGLTLVERVFSLFLLYVISPVVIASSVMDDGGRFKTWRDQVLVKFFSGCGAIMAINIYLLVVELVTSESVTFFSSSVMIFPASVLNQFMKLIFIAGGGVCMKQIQAIVGNIISSGAGDKMLAENERSNAGFRGVLAAPFTMGRAVANFKSDSGKYGFGSTVAQRLGLKTKYDYARDFALKGGSPMDMKNNQAQPSNNYNGNVPQNGNNIVANSVNQPNNNNNNVPQNNQNYNANDSKVGQNMVDNVIANANNNNMK